MSTFDSRRSRLGRVGTAVLVVGGLASSVGLVGASAAIHGHSAKGIVISTFKSAKLGTVLTSRTTLYTLKANSKACTSACRKYWPEVILPKGVTKATAGPGVNASMLGTIKVAGGLQVTYAGKPLYWFSKDTTAGMVKGNVTDTWGTWSDVVLVKPAGKPTTTTTALRPTTTSTTKPVTTQTTTPSSTTTVSPGGGGVGF